MSKNNITQTVLILFVLIFWIPNFCYSQKGIVAFDPFEYGAKGDGRTVDTKAIQKAIDDCYISGGGKVYLHDGCFISGTIYLRSNIILEIESGAILKASNNLDDFPVTASKYPSYTGEMETNKMLVYAEEANTITICGRGTIDGNGDYWIDGSYGSPSFSIRPRIIHFRGCQNVQVTNVTLYNSASWVQSYQSCRNVLISGIIVDSRPNKDIHKPRFADAPGRNCDGLDLIDCQRVHISNCNINSEDDAICLKSLSPGEACRDIVVNNCTVTSNASGIKIGTETAGTIEDIIVQNCTVYDTRVDGLSVMSVDGSKIRRVNFSNISMRNIKGAAVFIRLGSRNRTYRTGAVSQKGVLEDIVVHNIQGTGISGYGCSVTGVPGMPVRNIILSNINLRFDGGRKVLKIDDKIAVAQELTDEELSEIINRNVPELVGAYPRGEMFGRLPSYGFFIRHIENMSFNNVRIGFEKQDTRPALHGEEIRGLSVVGYNAGISPEAEAYFVFKEVEDAIISDCRPLGESNVFLQVKGTSSENISLFGNDFTKVKQVVDSQATMDKQITIGVNATRNQK